MKSIVIYHSITGNTKRIARAIQSGMGRSGATVELARLSEVNPLDLDGYDLIGLGSPVMYFRELHNVSNFIESLAGVDGKHGFVFCTHGAVPGNYMGRVIPAMIQRGMVIIGWNDWFGNCCFPCIPKPYFTDGHPDETDIKEAEDFGAEMVSRSRRITGGETQLVPVLPRGQAYDELYNPLMAEMRHKGRYARPTGGADEDMEERQRKFKLVMNVEFKVDQEKCRYPKCTFCIDNCPMQAIDFSVTPPVFNRNCDKCYLCEMACPNGAIEYDYEPLQATHNNENAVPQLVKSLEIFEARSKFRRLVPMEEIGWDTPFYRFPKPRYKVVR